MINYKTKWFKKPTVEGFTWARFEKVTKVDLSGKKKPRSYMKWVKYY